MKKQQSLIDLVVEILEITSEEARSLLINMRWGKHKVIDSYNDDPEQLSKHYNKEEIKEGEEGFVCQKCKMPYLLSDP